jgi:hypothetical protein
MDYTPSIPLWVQLPVFPEEGMVPQFLPGMPGVVKRGGKLFIDTAGESFDDDLLAFFEDYMAVSEAPDRLPGSRFALNATTGKGVAALLDTLGRIQTPPVAVKGQVTGPVTFCTGVKDQDGRAIFYDETLRDAAVKRLALNARWQIRTLSGPGCPVIIFIDEPALAGFGSSELISISKEEILACLQELVDAIHTDGGLAGIHVCANTDWSWCWNPVRISSISTRTRISTDSSSTVTRSGNSWPPAGCSPGVSFPHWNPKRSGGRPSTTLYARWQERNFARSKPWAFLRRPFSIPVFHHPQLRCRLPEPGPGQAGAGPDPGPVGNHS